MRARSRAGDQVTLRVVNSFENVPAPFLLPRDVPVRMGKYDWTNVNLGVRSFNGRMLSLQADVTCCSFYDGDAVTTRVTLIFRPSTLFEINVGHEANAIDLPTGAVDIHLATTDAVVNFTPDMQVALQAQYDKLYSGPVLFTAGSAATGMYRGIKLWEVAVNKARKVDRDSVAAALDSARIDQGPGGPAEMVPGKRHCRMNMYTAVAKGGKYEVVARSKGLVDPKEC